MMMDAHVRRLYLVDNKDRPHVQGVISIRDVIGRFVKAPRGTLV